jgi:hypothetical protein
MRIRKCVICRSPGAKPLLCDTCGRAYDRALAKDNTIYALIAWTARRARKFERAEMRRRCSTPEILKSLDKTSARLEKALAAKVPDHGEVFLRLNKGMFSPR